jgi:hypothetical protein
LRQPKTASKLANAAHTAVALQTEQSIVVLLRNLYPSSRRSNMQIETQGAPRINVSFEGKVVSSRPGCLEIFLTLLLGVPALLVILGLLP